MAEGWVPCEPGTSVHVYGASRENRDWAVPNLGLGVEKSALLGQYTDDTVVNGRLVAQLGGVPIVNSLFISLLLLK